MSSARTSRQPAPVLDRVSEGMRLAFGKQSARSPRGRKPEDHDRLLHSAVPGKNKGRPQPRRPQAPDPSHLKVSEIKVSGRIVAAPKLVGEKVVAAPVVEEAAAEPPRELKRRQRVARQEQQVRERQPQQQKVRNPQREQQHPRLKRRRVVPTQRAARIRSNFSFFFFQYDFYSFFGLCKKFQFILKPLYQMIPVNKCIISG